MDIVLIVIIAYNILLLGIGYWSSRRTKNQQDFYLGNRDLGAWVAALSASASSSSAWTLLGVSGAAYAWGLSTFWLLPGVLIGYYISWTWVAPRLMEISHRTKAVTLPEVLFSNFESKHKLILLRLSTIIILFSLTVYVAAQFQAAGTAFSTTLGFSKDISVILGASIILLYTLIGGFWAVSLTDTIQAMVMLLIAIILPLLLLMLVGGYEGLLTSIYATGSDEYKSFTGGAVGLTGLGFIIGSISIGFGYPGQPFVVNRFMATKDLKAIKMGRIIAMVWATIIFSGMITLGLCAKVMWSSVDNPETILFFASERTFGPLFSGIVTAAVLSAIMSTADSQLLSVSSSVDRDWTGGKESNISRSRISIVLVTILATLISLYAPATIFTRVIFAWTALGAAFVPMLAFRLLSKNVTALAAGLSVICGFSLTAVFHFLPDITGGGDILERMVPMATGFLVLFYSNNQVNKNK